MPSLVRAAALTNFAELARGFGLDPQRLMSDAGLQANVLASSRWQRVCVEFHRVHPETQARCLESDIELANRLEAHATFSKYRCMNGLTDCASPICLRPLLRKTTPMASTVRAASNMMRIFVMLQILVTDQLDALGRDPRFDPGVDERFELGPRLIE